MCLAHSIDHACFLLNPCGCVFKLIFAYNIFYARRNTSGISHSEMVTYFLVVFSLVSKMLYTPVRRRIGKLFNLYRIPRQEVSWNYLLTMVYFIWETGLSTLFIVIPNLLVLQLVSLMLLDNPAVCHFCYIKPPQLRRQNALASRLRLLLYQQWLITVKLGNLLAEAS